ncbi:fluoride efflux transporter FluC [Candidatus Halobonum tyrrellensis]|uniref:Fluoride-specific ion channel FluC n=1 Tax=Candidatus Halobonum tyrrellensis G22 TaxID=1324957 RepID=V4GRC4_9EURY|nr:CrcB family protein [Candidatus Halobonum tyrrellensis]ESP87606.1 camphor resistance protein crcb [Candidatus Halobonum tyrrellensis G22]
MREELGAVGVVGVGGAVGATLRYGAGLAVTGVGGTLLVNVVGSFLLGVLVTRSLPDRVRLFAATGLCSSFTTYSTFAVETLSLGPRAGAAYVAATYALGVAAAALGTAVGRRTRGAEA